MALENVIFGQFQSSKSFLRVFQHHLKDQVLNKIISIKIKSAIPIYFLSVVGFDSK